MRKPRAPDTAALSRHARSSQHLTLKESTMINTMRRSLISVFTVAALAAAMPAMAQTAVKSGKIPAVFQISDNDPQKWNLTLNNAHNVQMDLGAEAVELEIVVYGPGISMLKGDSPVATRVAAALKSGVKVVACENTMKAQKLTYADMLPNIGYVPAGVVELINKQREGYAYIRP
jgi:intracellular sulfur oxidation DsrE/DsrF family protein